MHGRTETPWCTLTRGGRAVTFKEVLAQVLDWLQHDQRLSYRALKRQFALDDDALEDLKEALLYTHAQVIVDESREMLGLMPPPASRLPQGPCLDTSA